jgi:hypothetical protein
VTSKKRVTGKKVTSKKVTEKHSERSASGVKNLILFRVRISEESPPFFLQNGFSIRDFLRGFTPSE